MKLVDRLNTVRWASVGHSVCKSFSFETPLLVVSFCSPPVSGSWPFHIIIWTVLAVGVLLSRPVDLEFTTWQSSWPSTESQRVQASAEDITFYEILTRCTQRSRDLLIVRCINLHFTYLLTCDGGYFWWGTTWSAMCVWRVLACPVRMLGTKMTGGWESRDQYANPGYLSSGS